MVDFKAKLDELRLQNKLAAATSGATPSMSPDFGEELPQLKDTGLNAADRLAIIRVVDLVRNGYTVAAMVGDVRIDIYKTKKSFMIKIPQ